MVMRAFTQLLGTMIIALTFGIAVPLLGATCAVAALVQLVHHKFALGRVIAVGLAAPQHSPPDLMQCTTLPWSCCVVISVTSLMFWLLFCIKNPSINRAAFSAAFALTIVLYVVSVVVYQLKDNCLANNRFRFRAFSIVSSVGINMEPLLEIQGNDCLWGEGSGDEDSDRNSHFSNKK
jgi:hypothetical protein